MSASFFLILTVAGICTTREAVLGSKEVLLRLLRIQAHLTLSRGDPSRKCIVFSFPFECYKFGF